MKLLFEDVVGLSVCRYDYQPGWKLISHCHRTYYQIFHIFDGEGLAWIDGVPHNIAAGKVLFIAPGMEHGLRPGGDRPLRTLDVKFRIHAPSLVALSLDISPIQDAENEGIFSLLEGIRREAEHHAPYFQQICQLKLAELLLCLARLPLLERLGESGPISPTAGDPDPLASSSEHPLVQNLLTYLAAHFTEHLDAGRLERDLSYSYRHLSEVTQAAFRMTPRQLLAAYRISMAKRSLLNGDAPLKEIAHGCGFANEHHFNRVFKQIVGEAPGKWRERQESAVFQNFPIDPSFADRDRTIR